MSEFLSEFSDDDSQTREIYARFGLASYLASVFEESVALDTTLITLIGDIRSIRSNNDWVRRYDEEIARAHTLPLGPALKRLAGLVQIPDDTTALFQEVRIARNYLIHHFFRDEIHEFYTPAGRSRLHDRLMSYVDLFSRADEQLSNLTSEVRHKIGLTDERLRRAFEELEGEYRQA